MSAQVPPAEESGECRTAQHCHEQQDHLPAAQREEHPTTLQAAVSALFGRAGCADSCTRLRRTRVKRRAIAGTTRRTATPKTPNTVSSVVRGAAPPEIVKLGGRTYGCWATAQ